jgi:hypothetical protein
MALFSLTTLRQGVFWLLAFLIFLCLANTVILGADGAEEMIIFEGRDPPQGDFNIFN